MARGRVEARKRRNKKQGPQEGNAGKQNNFVLRPIATYDAIGQEFAFLAAATFWQIGKQDMESPTKADEAMRLPLAQEIGKIFGRSAKLRK